MENQDILSLLCVERTIANYHPPRSEVPLAIRQLSNSTKSHQPTQLEPAAANLHRSETPEQRRTMKPTQVRKLRIDAQEDGSQKPLARSGHALLSALRSSSNSHRRVGPMQL